MLVVTISVGSVTGKIGNICNLLMAPLGYSRQTVVWSHYTAVRLELLDFLVFPKDTEVIITSELNTTCAAAGENST